MAREKPETWRCDHHYPIVVEKAGGRSRRARCLGCGALGPDREDVEHAMLALRDQARYKQSLGA
ncbi:MAG TPA: hypothetical protein VGV91_07900 [Rubrobacter sp.]|nr:hypothetical protein [Rubrobacter sp.]